MTEDDMIAMITKLASMLQTIASDGESAEGFEESPRVAIDPRKSIKEKSITCLECGKVTKTLTKRHLALHGLDGASYREKYGLKKGTPLTCKELQRARRAKMNDMKLWERRVQALEAKKRIDFGSIEDL